MNNINTKTIINQMSVCIEKGQLDAYKQNFENDPTNEIAKNAVTCVGAQNASLDNDKANQVSHVFLNTLKPHNLRATNQEGSGRCWMFAGLNMYRYMLIRGLGLERFEFSETYLFFYDKFERANTIIQYFIDNPNASHEDREVSIILRDNYTDGGYWNFFANLVSKYGLVPKDCMEETFHSGWTDNMNNILRGHIISCVNMIMSLRKKKTLDVCDDIMRVKQETMQNVYGCLVKFLGQPPEKFDWYFEDADMQKHVIRDLTPIGMYQMVNAIKVDDFVVLVNIPDKPFYQTYQIRNQKNVIEGSECIVLNLPIEELKKYASKSIMKGIPVWFAGDVSKGFGYHKSVLDEGIYKTDLVFGKQHPWTKADKLRLGFTEANHAMTLTGVNFDDKGHTTTWQVENSWGYFDHETPGMDGFLTMTDQWFTDNLVQIAVNKNFLSRSVLKCLGKEPVVLEPWDYMAPALHIK